MQYQNLFAILQPQYQSTVKIASILSHYLYHKHQLDLPGIGSFFLDPSSIDMLDARKQKSAILEGVRFESNTSIKESPDLIAYISSQSGKMKALANADLESHLQLVNQFLNIGKPYLFEGIGTLTKLKEGEYKFEPASVSIDKLKEYQAKAETHVISLEESSKNYESFLDTPKQKPGWRKPLLLFFIIAGIGIAIWAGYTIANKNKTEVAEVTNREVVPEPEPLQQPIQIIPSQDSLDKNTSIVQEPATPVAVTAAPVSGEFYKYILEVSNKTQALKRFSQLKTNLWDVHMETNDSTFFKLYLLLPAANADTTRILDSLKILSGKKVYIEH